jgi:hypothetical protein
MRARLLSAAGGHGGAEHPLLVGEQLLGAGAGALLKDAAFDFGGRRRRRGGEFVERFAAGADAADHPERERLVCVEGAACQAEVAGDCGR